MIETGVLQLFMLMRPALKRFVVARGVAPDEAEDVLQELYLKVDTLDTGPIAEPRSYLYRMADNLLLDRRRAAQRRARREQDWTQAQAGDRLEVDPRPDPERQLAARSELDAVTRALGALPERSALALRLFRIEGRSQKEIAAELGISLSAVEKHLQRAYRALIDIRGQIDAGEASPRRLDGKRGPNNADD